MKKIKLTESQLTEIIQKVISEQYSGGIIMKGDVPCDIWCKIKSAQEGSRGDVVKMIQQLLSADGVLGEYFYGRDNVGVNDGCAYDWVNCDGKYGPQTKKTIEKFQEEYGQGLEVDGKVGYNTLTALCDSINQEWMDIHGKDWVKFTLCNQQCQCTEGTDSPGDGIEDVINIIGDDVDLDDWGHTIDGIGNPSCDRIKACLYYSRVNEKGFPEFLDCIRGDFEGHYQATTDV